MVPRRESRVRRWLADHPETTRYAVIDDEDDELDDLPLFQPSRTTGLTDEVCVGVKIYLSGHSEKDMRRNIAVRLIQNLAAYFRAHRG